MSSSTAHSQVLIERRDLTYTYGRVLPQSLDVFAPAGAQNLPVVVMFHGNPPERSFMEPLAQAVAERGVVVFNVSTSHFADRRSSPVSDWYNDASCAVVYALGHAGDYGGDPERIVLVGYSGGAGIAMSIAMNRSLVAGNCVEAPARFPRSEAVVSIAGDYYSREFIEDLRAGTALDPEFWRAAFRNDTAIMDRYLDLLDVENLMRSRTARRVDITLVGGMPLSDNIAPLSNWFSFMNSAGLGGYDLTSHLLSNSTHRSFATPGARAFKVTVDAVSDAAHRLP